MLFRQRRGSRTTIIFITKKWNILESIIEEGDNPVHVICYKDSSILSMAGHEKSCQKQPGPSGKAKYS